MRLWEKRAVKNAVRNNCSLTGTMWQFIVFLPQSYNIVMEVYRLV